MVKRRCANVLHLQSTLAYCLENILAMETYGLTLLVNCKNVSLSFSQFEPDRLQGER